MFVEAVLGTSRCLFIFVVNVKKEFDELQQKTKKLSLTKFTNEKIQEYVYETIIKKKNLLKHSAVRDGRFEIVQFHVHAVDATGQSVTRRFARILQQGRATFDAALGLFFFFTMKLYFFIDFQSCLFKVVFLNGCVLRCFLVVF